MKKLITLLMVLALCFGTIACGNSTNAPAENAEAPASAASEQQALPQNEEKVAVTGISEDATLNVALVDEPDFLIPQQGTPTDADNTIMRCMYDTLFTQDAEGNTVPSAAESYEWVDDTHLRVVVRKGMIAADGTEMNANDVLYTLQTGNTGNYANYFQMYLNVDNCVVEDDYTIVLELASPNPTFLFILSDISFSLIDQSSVEAAGGLEANVMNPQCGAGRYKFVEWKAGQYIKLERNDNYWGGTDGCYYKYLNFTWVSDPASRVLNVQSGDVDVAIGLSYSDVSAVVGNNAVTTYGISTPRTVVVTFNCAEGSLFNNAKLREAVYYCINAKDCAAVLFQGYGKTAETGVPTNVYYYYPQADKVETNLEKAKQCLADAGYPDGFAFTLTVEPSAGYDVVGELIQAQLLEVGIEMKVDKVEIVDYFTVVAGGTYDAYIGTLSCGDAITFLNQCDGRKDYLASHGGPAYWNDEMIQWVDQCYSTDSAKSLEGFQHVQELAFENHIYVGLCDYINFTLTNANLAGFANEGFGYTLAYAFRPAA